MQRWNLPQLQSYYSNRNAISCMYNTCVCWIYIRSGKSDVCHYDMECKISSNYSSTVSLLYDIVINDERLSWVELLIELSGLSRCDIRGTKSCEMFTIVSIRFVKLRDCQTTRYVRLYFGTAFEIRSSIGPDDVLLIRGMTKNFPSIKRNGLSSFLSVEWHVGIEVCASTMQNEAHTLQIHYETVTQLLNWTFVRVCIYYECWAFRVKRANN